MDHPQLSLSPDQIQHIRSSSRITVLTGAGVSAESGIPTFRDSQTGLWANYRPEELATPSAFAANPELVWQWYNWRRKIIEQSLPNPAHFALVEMAAKIPGFTLITQNIDGLHRKAGSAAVIELHGNIYEARCIKENTRCDSWGPEIPPRCPTCGALLRPNVIWFGESLPPGALNTAIQASRNCDVFFSIGTSGVVEPAATLAYEALRRRALVIEINPQPTPLTVYVSAYLPQPAGQALPALLAAVWPG